MARVGHQLAQPVAGPQRALREGRHLHQVHIKVEQAGMVPRGRGVVELPLEHLHRLLDRKSTRLNSSHRCISYAVFCLKKTTDLNVCPVCLGLPGTLPVLNKKPAEYAVLPAMALTCRLIETSIFARKNSFYPDLPKGYP